MEFEIKFSVFMFPNCSNYVLNTLPMYVVLELQKKEKENETKTFQHVNSSVTALDIMGEEMKDQSDHHDQVLPVDRW